MPIQSNVSSGISKPNATDIRAKSKNGIGCHNTSYTCGRAGTTGHRATSMGQKVTSNLFLKSKQDTAKYNLYMFMIKLLGLYGSRAS
jgi:hypothetical protein